MLSIKAASNKRIAAKGVGVKRPKKKAKLKRPRGTLFEKFTCELDKNNCIHDENGLCIAHKTPAGKSKVKCLVNPEVAQLSCGYDKIKVEMECDVCFHVFPITLNKITSGKWCYMCSNSWKHCGVETCTFCFERSFAYYKGVTLNGKKKVDCIVDESKDGSEDDLLLSLNEVPQLKSEVLHLPLGCHTKIKFECDVCFHVFPISLNSVTSNGQWCGMCSNHWKHCGVMTCTFCFDRSLESYTGLTLNDKKKADCTVNKADLRLAMSSAKKVKFKCDVCLHVFSMRLDSVTSGGNWCPTCKNKTELMVLNFLQEMNIKVVTQYIPGGMKQMKKNYGKYGKLDFYLPNFNIIWELDGRQHNMQVTEFGDTTLFHRMILDKWKEFWARKYGLNVIRFDQEAIWGNKYDWKQEMENLLTFTSDKLRRQLKETKKRYKTYAKQHNNKSKRRSIPEKVKRSHKKAHTPLAAIFTIMSFITKYK
jgi:very-short-patch-repair endonuclease